MSELKADELEHIAYMQTLEIQSLNARIAELEAAQRWIPVSERLPEFDQDMFAVVEGEFKVGHFYPGLDFIKNKYENIYFSAGGEGLLVATHWMPLPQPPEVTG